MKKARPRIAIIVNPGSGLVQDSGQIANILGLSRSPVFLWRKVTSRQLTCQQCHLRQRRRCNFLEAFSRSLVLGFKFFIWKASSKANWFFEEFEHCTRQYSLQTCGVREAENSFPGEAVWLSKGKPWIFRENGTNGRLS